MGDKGRDIDRVWQIVGRVRVSRAYINGRYGKIKRYKTVHKCHSVKIL